MTEVEFYEVVKEYAKKEMHEQGKKATETTGIQSAMHSGASHEAAKFYQMVISMYLENKD